MKTFTEFLSEAKDTPEITIFFPLIFGKKGTESSVLGRAKNHEQAINRMFGSMDKFKKKVEANTYDKAVSLIEKSNCKVVANVDYSLEQANKVKDFIKKNYPWCDDYIFVSGTMTNIKKISTVIAPFLAKEHRDILGSYTRKILPNELIIQTSSVEKEVSKKKEPKIKTETKPKKKPSTKKVEEPKTPFKTWGELTSSEFIRYVQDKLSLSTHSVEKRIEGKELTTQYMCKWKNPSDEEDYDWKELSAASHKAIKSAIAFFNKKYGVTINYYPQEKEYIVYVIK